MKEKIYSKFDSVLTNFNGFFFWGGASDLARWIWTTTDSDPVPCSAPDKEKAIISFHLILFFIQNHSHSLIIVHNHFVLIVK